jgi:DNA-binding transcriptional ArsR family regulator
MLDIQVIDDPAAATVALEPVRSRLLSELVAPASAATLATRVGLARQKVNYHLHALEAHGLVRLAQERKWGGLTERLLVATAASYVVSPSALGPVAVDLNREVDRLSANYLIALGARVVREVDDLVRRANEAGKRLATLAVDTEIRFRSPTDRAAFSNELTEAITKLVSKYHDEVVYEYRDFFVISYSPNEHGYEGVFCIRASADGVKLYFNRGKELPDPAKLLQGSGNQMRSINVEGASTLAHPEVAGLIDEAIARNPVPFARAGRGSVIIRSTSAKKRRRPRPA